MKNHELKSQKDKTQTTSNTSKARRSASLLANIQYVTNSTVLEAQQFDFHLQVEDALRKSGNAKGVDQLRMRMFDEIDQKRRAQASSKLEDAKPVAQSRMSKHDEVDLKRHEHRFFDSIAKQFDIAPSVVKALTNENDTLAKNILKNNREKRDETFEGYDLSYTAVYFGRLHFLEWLLEEFPRAFPSSDSDYRATKQLLLENGSPQAMQAKEKLDSSWRDIQLFSSYSCMF